MDQGRSSADPGACPELELESAGPEVTERLGAGLGARLGPGAVLALAGDLGAGKTCLVRGLAEGLGSVDPVSSPTYTLAHEYAGRLTLYHLDAWMSAREAAFLAAGGEELLEAGGVCAIEWAGQVAEWLPRPRLELTLIHLTPTTRRLRARRVLRAGEPDPAHEGAWDWLEAVASGATPLDPEGDGEGSPPADRPDSKDPGSGVNPAGRNPLDRP
ncbi:MAG: tRNA (adenosine(37)-N6)-threonylcarbamoyltransferase complex ATPase subunit type 1 TsaE [Planctomycetota bacterium]|jgi:tRNA threonylcarbamoyladenosine biosynthesis protein TsaE